MIDCKYGFKHWDGDDCAICNRDKRIAELEQQLAELREAAATYKNNGHSPSCRRHTLYTKGGRCICGYDELAALLKKAGGFQGRVPGSE